MSELIITSAELGHLEEVKRAMRTADAREAIALGLDPRQALQATLDGSQVVYAALVDTDVLCLFGVTAPAHGRRLLWCVTTGAILHHWLAFARASRDVLEVLVNRLGPMGNWVSADNYRSIRWLAWLGAELEEAVAFGPRGEMFHRFSFGRKAA